MNNNYVKLEIAEEVMNAMIGRYLQKGYDDSNEMLMTLLREKMEMSKFNWEVINKVLNVYAPMLKSGKLSNCQIKPSEKACKNCQCQNQQELDK